MSLDLDSLPLQTTFQITLPIAQLPGGSAVAIPVIVVTGRQRHPRILVVGGIHGDEYEGPRAITTLTGALNPTILEGTVIGVPVANPPAFAAGTRTSPIDGLNLARIFPGDAQGTISQQIAHRLFTSLARACDLLVDLHSGGARYHFAHLAGFYTVGGAAGALSRRAAEAMSFPYLWQMPANPGVLSYAASQHGIPAVGAEVTGIGGCLPEDVDLYVAALWRILAMMELTVLPDHIPQPERAKNPWHGDWLLSPTGGLFWPHVRIGQAVSSGDLLATFHDLLGEEITRMVAQESGTVLALRHLRSINPGEWAVMVLSDTPVGGES